MLWKAEVSTIKKPKTSKSVELNSVKVWEIELWSKSIVQWEIFGYACPINCLPFQQDEQIGRQKEVAIWKTAILNIHVCLWGTVSRRPNPKPASIMPGFTLPDDHFPFCCSGGTVIWVMPDFFCIFFLQNCKKQCTMEIIFLQ